MKRYITHSLFAMLLVTTACTDNEEATELVQGDKPVNISGIMTRAGETPGGNIYVKAFHANSSNVYFDETLVTIPDGLSAATPNSITFPGAAPYYPVGGAAIDIFAYSGKAPGLKMTLTSGQDIVNDAILSNQGTTENITIIPPGVYSGTQASSNDPARVLQFRHVMTQLIVKVAVDDTESPEVDPVPAKLQFTFEDGVAAATGRYPIRGDDTQSAVELSGTYTIQKGTNYLVPSGEDLLTKKLKSLVIDDYVATPADLNSFTIVPKGGQMDMKLLPGLSYTLTLTVSKLKVTGITLTKQNWSAREVTGTTTYTPYALNLSLGSYDSTNTDDAISKVILGTSEGKSYIGQAVTGKTGIQFVTLPDYQTIAPSSVSLYTKKGLLITSSIAPTNYDGNTLTLTLPLSKGGMLALNPGNATISETNPYVITTPVQFMNVEKDLTSHYIQNKTVDLNTLNLIDVNRVFNGFGDFSGTYNGSGYRIDGIDIAATGLFKSNSGKLKNIRLSIGKVNAAGMAQAGAICGINRGQIVACINEAQLVNTAGATTSQGGIAGLNTGTGVIIGCINTGTILYGSVAGGICGSNQNINAGAIAACINTGMLNPQATSLGFILGTSTASAAAVLRTNFGLVGSAQRVVGGPEYTVGSTNVEVFDCSAVEPLILRNELQANETDENKRIVNKLNAEMTSIAAGNVALNWVSGYEYIYNNMVTSITWPAPKLK